MTDNMKIAMYGAKKMCCAQVLVLMGLDMLGEQNDRLVSAASGLCVGVRSGLLCGALTGGALMLSMFDAKVANEELIPQLTEWFEDEVGEKYGGMNCGDIIEGDSALKKMRCPLIVQGTFVKAKSLLSQAGLI